MTHMPDDQKMTTLYHLEHPEFISIHSQHFTSLDTSMECMYKENMSRYYIKKERDGSRNLYVDNQESSIGLMHFNGGSLTQNLMLW